MAQRRISSTAPAIERRVGPQLGQLIGVLEQREQPDDSIVLVVSLPAVTSCTKNDAEVDVGHELAAELGVEDQRGEVLAAAPPGGARPANSMAYIAMARWSPMPTSSPSCEVRVLALGVLLGQLWIVGQSASGMPTSSPDHLRGQAGGDVVDELHLALRRPRSMISRQIARIWLLHARR